MFNILSKEEQEKQRIEKKKEKKRQEAKIAIEEIGWLLSQDEQILDVFRFFKNYIVATDKKIIYVNVELAKARNYSVIPYNKISGFTFREPTGLASETRLMVMGGGDSPLLDVSINFDDEFKDFCKVLSDNI